MSYPRHYHRKHYLIDKKFQLAFVMKFCAVVILASLAIGTFIFYMSRNSTTVAIENTRVFVKPTSDFILPQLVVTVILVSLVFFLYIVRHGGYGDAPYPRPSVPP